MTTKPTTCRQCGAVFNRTRHVAFYCSKVCAVVGRLDKSGPCWLWTGSKNSMGYGNLGFEGKGHYAHRIMFEDAHGSAEGGVVCHRCDTPLCCNPDHLFLGTQADNLKDMRTKNRHFTKITAEDVLSMRSLRGKITLKEMAQRFGVSFGCVNDIIYKKTWKHLL